MLLLPLPPSTFCCVGMAGKLNRAPSASLSEYVPLGDSAFFLGEVVIRVVVALPCLGEAPFLGELPPRVGERLGEISPSGDRTGDFDLAGLRLGDKDRRLGEFAFFLGDKLRDDLPRMGDKLPLLLPPIEEALC